MMEIAQTLKFVIQALALTLAPSNGVEAMLYADPKTTVAFDLVKKDIWETHTLSAILVRNDSVCSNIYIKTLAKMFKNK